MKVLPINELMSHQTYLSRLISKNSAPPDKEYIENYLYDITKEECSLILPLKGSATISTDSSKIHLTPGSLTFVPPYQTVLYSETSDFKYLRVKFILKEAKTDEVLIFSQKPFQLTKTIPREIEYIMYEIDSYYPFSTASQQAHGVSSFYKLIATIIDHLYSFEDTKEVMPKIYIVIKYLQDNFVKNDSCKDLADMVNLSEPYFRKCFKKATNMSPIEYRNYLRIEYAKYNITHCDTYDTLRKLSEWSGFEDMYYFSRLFKKYTGVSPRQYYKMHFAPDLPNREVFKRRKK